eukprot:3855860-Pyramimonas_sp.AAC.1
MHRLCRWPSLSSRRTRPSLRPGASGRRRGTPSRPRASRLRRARRSGRLSGLSPSERPPTT